MKIWSWAQEKTWIKPYRPVNEAKFWTWRHVWYTLEMNTLRLGRCRHINMPLRTSFWVSFVSKLSNRTISLKIAFKNGSIPTNGQNDYFLKLPAQKAQKCQKSINSHSDLTVFDRLGQLGDRSDLILLKIVSTVEIWPKKFVEKNGRKPYDFWATWAFLIVVSI